MAMNVCPNCSKVILTETEVKEYIKCIFCGKQFRTVQDETDGLRKKKG